MARKSPVANENDPSLLRQIETLNNQSLIRPNVVSNPTVFALATQSTNNNNVTITQSINNDSGDIVTVYNTDGTINVTSIDQTINDYTTVDSGVSQIIAGENVTISSTQGNGVGVVTISVNANLSLSDSRISNGTSNVEVLLNGPVTIGASGTPNTVIISNTELRTTGSIISNDANLGNAARANFFIGDGSLLTNLPNVGGDYSNSNVASYLPFYTGTLAGNSIGVTGISSANVFVGNGAFLTNLPGANVNGTVANATFAITADNVSNAAQPNITSVGALTSLSVIGNVTGDYFIGNGYLLTGIVANTANYAHIAGESYSVSAANIVGNVQYANTALSIDGSNVSGEVQFAATANNVAGSNVSGEVSYAAVANSVEGSNVVGFVNDANFATAANTVILPDQPNITAVGNLTFLSVIGNADVNTLNVSNGILLSSSVGSNISGVDYITANYFVGNGSSLTGLPTQSIIANGNSNVSIATATGNVVLSTQNTVNTSQTNRLFWTTNGTLRLQNPAASLTNAMIIEGYRDAQQATNLVFLRGRGTLAVPQSVQSGDILGGINGSGINSSNIWESGNGAVVRFQVANTYNSTSDYLIPMNVQILTVDNVGNVATYRTTDFFANGTFTPAGNIVAIANSDHILGNSITANFFIGNGSLLTDIISSTANYANFAGNAFSVDGSNVVGAVSAANIANVAYSVDGANVFGEVAYAAQANSIGILASITVTGNIGNADYVIANYFVGNGSSLTDVTATTAGTVTSNAQPNITSIGILSTLSVSGNANTGNIGATNGVFTNISGNGAGLTNLSPANMVGMPSAMTLLVDPDGSDVTGDGSDNKPFATVQAAHDYAAANIASTAYVVIKLNAGSYAGNVTLTRPRTAIVGASDGIIRSSWITGSVTINMTSGATILSSDIFALENLIITSSSDAVVLGGNQRYVFFGRNIYVYSSSTASALSVTNTSTGGIKVDLLNAYLQSDGSGTTLVTSNTYYLNVNSSTIDANTGPALSLTTTGGLIGTTRISTSSGSNTVVVNSPFTPGGAITFGVCTFESTATNGNGIYIASGATVALGGCAFNVPTGTGFAVAGAAGSFLVKSANNNQIAYNTNGATQGTVTVVPMTYL
jgi:hypothetical protein